MNSNLGSMQESYLQGLRHITGGGSSQKMVVSDTSQRAGLGTKATQQQGKMYGEGGNVSTADRRAKLQTAFDISNKAIFLSLFFWMLLMYLIYIGIGYAIMLIRVTWTDLADIPETCPEKFDAQQELNLKIVNNYPLGESGPYISRFPSDHVGAFNNMDNYSRLPPLVTGVTSEQFYQVQGLIQHFHTAKWSKHEDFKLIIYDLGLWKREREILQQYCSCDVRTLDYSDYPPHVADSSNFAWRPIVLQILLEEFGSVAYVDPTTRFKDSASLGMLAPKESGPDFLLWDAKVFTSLVAYTNPRTFKFFNETRCVFNEANMLESQLLVFYRTETTWQQIMKPLLKCALNLDCIAPSYSHLSACLHYRRQRTTGCHAFDISALGIILNRGQQLTVHGKINHVVPQRFTSKDEAEVALFMEQPWTYGQLMILACIPWVVFLFAIRKPLFRFLSDTIVK